MKNSRKRTPKKKAANWQFWERFLGDDLEMPVRYLPQILFVLFLGVIYIGSSHQVESNIRELNRLKEEVENLRADYTTLKADYMMESKRSAVALKAKALEIYEADKAPIKIEVVRGEY